MVLRLDLGLDENSKTDNIFPNSLPQHPSFPISRSDLLGGDQALTGLTASLPKGLNNAKDATYVPATGAFYFELHLRRLLR